MSTIVTLDQPKARITHTAPGFVRVYGWKKELVTERGCVPLSELVGIYSFRWTARRAMRRWLAEHAPVPSFSRPVYPSPKSIWRLLARRRRNR